MNQIDSFVFISKYLKCHIVTRSRFEPVAVYENLYSATRESTKPIFQHTYVTFFIYAKSFGFFLFCKINERKDREFGDYNIRQDQVGINSLPHEHTKNYMFCNCQVLCILNVCTGKLSFFVLHIILRWPKKKVITSSRQKSTRLKSFEGLLVSYDRFKMFYNTTNKDWAILVDVQPGIGTYRKTVID